MILLSTDQRILLSSSFSFHSLYVQLCVDFPFPLFEIIHGTFTLGTRLLGILSDFRSTM